jgi:hypothetical protein
MHSAFFKFVYLLLIEQAFVCRNSIIDADDVGNSESVFLTDIVVVIRSKVTPCEIAASSVQRCFSIVGLAVLKHGVFDGLMKVNVVVMYDCEYVCIRCVIAKIFVNISDENVRCGTHIGFSF